MRLEAPQTHSSHRAIESPGISTPAERQRVIRPGHDHRLRRPQTSSPHGTAPHGPLGWMNDVPQDLTGNERPRRCKRWSTRARGQIRSSRAKLLTARLRRRLNLCEAIGDTRGSSSGYLLASLVV